FIYPGIPKSSPYHPSGIDGVNCPEDASAKTTDHAVFFRIGADIIQIPEQILKRSHSGDVFCELSGCFNEKCFFIAVHSTVGNPHTVACIERSSGKLVWKSTACGSYLPAIGRLRSWVSVQSTDDDRVFVFGTSSTGLYLHGFRATDGKSLVHFSSQF